MECRIERVALYGLFAAVLLCLVAMPAWAGNEGDSAEEDQAPRAGQSDLLSEIEVWEAEKAAYLETLDPKLRRTEEALLDGDAVGAMEAAAEDGVVLERMRALVKHDPIRVGYQVVDTQTVNIIAYFILNDQPAAALTTALAMGFVLNFAPKNTLDLASTLALGALGRVVTPVSKTAGKVVSKFKEAVTAVQNTAALAKAVKSQVQQDLRDIVEKAEAMEGP